jgi:peptidoglycan/LPS O-acetylase OafA/YrhL
MIKPYAGSRGRDPLTSRKTDYRSDIDGLRAIAVLLVIAFHAFPAVMPGGFVGVDVFFVISGYLITGIILRELGSENFSPISFYARRIHRVFPALIVVLSAVFGVPSDRDTDVPIHPAATNRAPTISASSG